MSLFDGPPPDSRRLENNDHIFDVWFDEQQGKSTGSDGKEAIYDAKELIADYEREEKLKAPKLVKDASQFKRSIKDINGLYPGWYTKTEHYVTIYGGAQIKRDFGGFADLCGVSDGRFIAVQITTVDQVGPHIRKYVSDAKSGGLGDTTIESNLRAFLACGGIFLIFGYYKEGARWQHKVTHVDASVLDAAVARKRKK